MTWWQYLLATAPFVAIPAYCLHRELLIVRRLRKRNADKLAQMQRDISTALDAERKKKQ